MKHSFLQSCLISTEKAGLMALFICNVGNDNTPRLSSASPSWPKNMWVNLQFSIMPLALCPTVEIPSWLLGSLGCGSNIWGTTRAKSILSYTQLVWLGVEAASHSWMALHPKTTWPTWPYLYLQLFSFFVVGYFLVCFFSCIAHKHEVVALK